MVDLLALQRIAETDYADIVVGTRIVDAKLRVLLIDESYLDFWWSLEIPGRFAHHWERSHVDGTVYRHDNMPHSKWVYCERVQVAHFPLSMLRARFA